MIGLTPLPRNEVHLWCVALDIAAASLERSWRLLDEQERGRAERLVFERDRRRFVACRGSLKTVLAAYLGVGADRVLIGVDARGKPRLIHPASTASLRFNVSHSGELAVFAIGRGREVGIDIERVRPIPDMDSIVERHFSPIEQIEFRSVAREYAPEAFFNCWSRKEAYLKATGRGLSFPSARLSVSLAPGKPAALRGVQGLPQEAARWSLRAFVPRPDYVGALVAEGRDWRLSHRSSYEVQQP